MYCDKIRLLVIYMYNLWFYIVIVILVLKKIIINIYFWVFEIKIFIFNDFIFKILIFMWIIINIFLDIYVR